MYAYVSTKENVLDLFKFLAITFILCLSNSIDIQILGANDYVSSPLSKQNKNIQEDKSNKLF